MNTSRSCIPVYYPIYIAKRSFFIAWIIYGRLRQIFQCYHCSNLEILSRSATFMIRGHTLSPHSQMIFIPNKKPVRKASKPRQSSHFQLLNAVITAGIIYKSQWKDATQTKQNNKTIDLNYLAQPLLHTHLQISLCYALFNPSLSSPAPPETIGGGKARYPRETKVPSATDPGCAEQGGMSLHCICYLPRN